MAKDLTTSEIDRQKILNNPYALAEIEKAAGIRGIPFEGKPVVLKEQVAAFFEVTPRTVENYLERYSAELARNGYEVIDGKRLQALKLAISAADDPEKNLGIINRAPRLAVFDFRAFLNLAMLMAESPRAALLRKAILDIVIDTINARTGGGTKYINQRDEDFIHAAFVEENYRKQFTDALREWPPSSLPIPAGDEVADRSGFVEHLEQPAGEPAGEAIETTVELPGGPVTIDPADDHAGHLRRLAPGHGRVEVGVALAGIADEEEAAAGEVGHDLLDHAPLRLLSRGKPPQRRRILEAEELEVHRAGRQAALGEEAIEAGGELPGTRRDIVERRPCGLPAAVDLRHAGDGAELAQEGVGEELTAIADGGHLDRVVDVGDHRQPLVVNQMDPPCPVRHRLTAVVPGGLRCPGLVGDRSRGGERPRGIVEVDLDLEVAHPVGRPCLDDLPSDRHPDSGAGDAPEEKGIGAAPKDLLTQLLFVEVKQPPEDRQCQDAPPARRRQWPNHHPRHGRPPAVSPSDPPGVGGEEDDHGGGRREVVPDGPGVGPGVRGPIRGVNGGGKSPWLQERQDRLHAVGTSFYNGGPGKFLPVRSAWRRAWVSRRRARVGANLVKRSAACGPASAIARVDDGFRRRVSLLIFRLWGADSGPPAGITVWDHFWAPGSP